MKKIKFNKKTKMFLSALALTTMSATVLAACKPTPETEKKSEPDKKTKPIQKEVKATKEQLDFVDDLIANKGFQNLLNLVVESSLTETEPLINDVIKASLFDKSKLLELKNALGQTSDASSMSENSSFFANFKKVEENYESKKTNTANFPNAKDSTELGDKLKTISTDAETLLNLMDANVLTETGKTELKATGESLKTILNDYAKSKTNEVGKTKLKELKKVLENLEKNDIFLKLESLLKAGLKLDRSVNELIDFIEAKTPKFLKTAGDSFDDAELKTALEKLNFNSKTKILGTIGKDLWPGGPHTRIPETVSTKNSTGLYSINWLLKETKHLFLWRINPNIKEITFNKGLLLKDEAAINLLAVYIDQKFLEGALRLKAYLLNDDYNLEKVLNGLFTEANTVSSGTFSYAKFVGGENSDFVKALNIAIEKETYKDKKAKIAAIKDAFLKTDGVSKTLDAFYNTNVLTAAAELELKVLEVNRAMGLVTNYGDTLKILGEFNYLQENVLTPLENINKFSLEEKNTLTLFDELKTEIKDATVGNLKAAIEAYLSETGYQPDVAKSLNSFIKKENDNYTGYYYTLINGAEKTGAVAKQLSLSELKAELEKFESGENKPLTKGINLLKKHLKNYFKFEKSVISMPNLYEIYNNGDVLWDYQTPWWWRG